MPKYKQMDPQVKSDLIAALRSEKYKQARGALERSEEEEKWREEHGYGPTRYSAGNCCLGVLCNLAIETGAVKVEKIASGVPPYVPRTTFKAGRTQDDSFPPPLVGAWAGLSKGAQQKLAFMNDDGSSFSEIADWIEEYL